MAEYSIPGGRFRRMMRSFLLSLVLLAAAGAPAAAEESAPIFPDLEMAGADGGSIRLSQLKGNVILLNVWATWCGPCRMELPIVQRMYDKYSDRNFVVLAVNVDADRNRIQPFMKRYNISLPIYYASPEDAGQMTAMGIPSTFILGPDRTMLDHVVGYSAQAEVHWKQIIEKRLKPTKKAR
jgi:thiol-disulfide isomerase/thioredoxin